MQGEERLYEYGVKNLLSLAYTIFFFHVNIFQIFFLNLFYKRANDK